MGKTSWLEAIDWLANFIFSSWSAKIWCKIAVQSQLGATTYLLQFSFLVIQALLKLLIRRCHRLEAIFVAVLDGFHLHTEVFNRLVEVLDHCRELIVLLDQFFDLI